jgi:predicted restriction endonuclease
MSRYYLKKLGKQELGVTSAGNIARGRYVYISKACTEFFPHLSKTVINDNVLIPIIPPFSDSKIYSAYVYHNDKFTVAGGTRDEYRLYLNRELDPERQYYQPDDILVFEKIETEGVIPQYLLYRYNSRDIEYETLDKLIELSPIRGGHSLIPDELTFLPKRDVDTAESEVVIAPEIRKDIIEQQEEALAAEDEDVEETRGASLFGPDSFRDFVLLAYGYKCAITGTVIRFKKLSNLEAAHIQPKAHAGTFLPCNGIALSRDMHWAFDKGMITIGDDYKIVVHEQLMGTPLKEYAGKSILLPVEPYFQPEKKFLKHHREKVFGLFLYSGSIRILKTDRPVS